MKNTDYCYSIYKMLLLKFLQNIVSMNTDLILTLLLIELCATERICLEALLTVTQEHIISLHGRTTQVFPEGKHNRLSVHQLILRHTILTMQQNNSVP